MKRATLIQQIKQRRSFLCVGLDPDIEKMPEKFKASEFPLLEFCQAIAEATAPYCVAFKPNTAFFEAEGTHGWTQFEKLCAFLKKQYPNHLLIADAKRGDIGNTSEKYAQGFLGRMNCDAITVAPYMGSDSVGPFFMTEKWVILLLLTSNPGAKDFQGLYSENGIPFYKEVASKATHWGTPENLMFVTGATQASHLKEIREILPDYFFLVPGVGAQGGSLKEVCEAALTKDIGLLINASRSILYASKGEDYLEAAASEAKKLTQEMSIYFPL